MAVATGPGRHLPGRHVLAAGLVLGLLGVTLLVLVVDLVVRAGDDGGGPSSSARVHGSGTAVSRTRHVPPFTGVTLTGALPVTVQVGGARSVVVHADDNLVRHVTTEVHDGALAVGTTGSFTTGAPMSVVVTVPALDTVVLEGSGTVVVDGVRGRHVVVRLPGTGTVRVSGSADELQATLTGTGALQLQDLVARDVTARLAGVGEILVHVTRDLHATVSGAGTIRYRGDPASVVEDVTGTGSVTAG